MLSNKYYDLQSFFMVVHVHMEYFCILKVGKLQSQTKSEKKINLLIGRQWQTITPVWTVASEKLSAKIV